MSSLPLVPPLFPAGKEPLPPGFTEDDRQVMLQNKKTQNYMQMGMESCLAKTVMAGGMGMCRVHFFDMLFTSLLVLLLKMIGFGMGAFISLMSSSFAYEDPLIRQQQQAIGAISTTAKAKEIFAEMGRGMWKSGKGFAKVTVLFAGTECVIESVNFFFFSFSFGIRPRRSWVTGTDFVLFACVPFSVKCSNTNLLHRPAGDV